jgi:hypothetical protein
MKSCPDEILGKGIIYCTKCRMKWCCIECAIDCDAIDQHYFDVLTEADYETTPNELDIICCQCSGSKFSWRDE